MSNYDFDSEHSKREVYSKLSSFVALHKEYQAEVTQLEEILLAHTLAFFDKQGWLDDYHKVVNFPSTQDEQTKKNIALRFVFERNTDSKVVNFSNGFTVARSRKDFSYISVRLPTELLCLCVLILRYAASIATPEEKQIGAGYYEALESDLR
jgi:hypothetical protein